jgi:serine/threonine protein kinase
MIHYSTVCDLVFSKALEQLHGFPHIHAYDITETKIRIDMDYLGKTVHDAARSYSKQTRFHLASRLLEYLVASCYNLWYNGIQHTDLKPGNILVDNHDAFHLIDFNCMSVKKAGGTWTASIGTWQYVAPEILFSEKPHDTSMVWSIGMVMADWLLGTYPISAERMGRYTQITPSSQSQSKWKQLMHNIRRKYPDVLQLEQRYIAEMGEWWPRLSPMLRWSPNRRWSLERVIQSLYPLRIHVRNLVLPVLPCPSHVPDYIREQTLTTGFAFLQAVQMEYLLVQTVSLFDLCYVALSGDAFPPNLLWLCAWAIQGYLTNQFLFDNDNSVLTVYQHYHIPCDQVLHKIYHVLDACHYRAWQKEWFMYLPAGASSQPIQWRRVLNILLEQKDPYSPQGIAEAYQADV